MRLKGSQIISPPGAPTHLSLALDMSLAYLPTPQIFHTGSMLTGLSFSKLLD